MTHPNQLAEAIYSALSGVAPKDMSELQEKGKMVQSRL